MTTKQKQNLNRLAKKLQLKLVILYGSKATGKTNQESDLDLGILAANKPDYELFKRLFEVLSGIFQGETIDIRFLNEADPLFLMQVVKNSQLIFGQERDFNELKIQVNRRYIDDGRKYFPYQNQLLQSQQNYLSKAII